MKSRPTAAPGKVRIIGGRLRGSRLPVPIRPGLRPTPDRVRETLFNWLAPIIAGSRCLDLFAGSGALGIEAASRGSREVVLVERDAELASALAAEIDRLKIPEARALALGAVAFLERTAEPFDIVFLDPPFDADLWSSTAELLESRGWLKPGSRIYVEHPAGVVLRLPPNWQALRRGRAGEVGYALYARELGDSTVQPVNC